MWTECYVLNSNAQDIGIIPEYRTWTNKGEVNGSMPSFWYSFLVPEQAE